MLSLVDRGRRVRTSAPGQRTAMETWRAVSARTSCDGQQRTATGRPFRCWSTLASRSMPFAVAQRRFTMRRRPENSRSPEDWSKEVPISAFSTVSSKRRRSVGPGSSADKGSSTTCAR